MLQDLTLFGKVYRSWGNCSVTLTHYVVIVIYCIDGNMNEWKVLLACQALVSTRKKLLLSTGREDASVMISLVYKYHDINVDSYPVN